MKLFEILQDDILKKIVSICSEVITAKDSDYSVQDIVDDKSYKEPVERSPGYVEVTMVKGDDRNSFTFKVTKDGTIGLYNMYLPSEFRGKGVLTEILTKIRKLPGLSGKCFVSVGMNQEGWKKIIARAGFEQVKSSDYLG